MIDTIKTSDDVESEVNDLLHKKEFGAGLRKAREKLGLSTTDVAESLLISVDIIKALENSQAEALPALAFTQGYIRSYARLLEVSADKIIEDYAQMAPDSKQALSPHSMLPTQKSSNDMFMRVISISFVLLAISVLGYWLYSTDFTTNSDFTNDFAEFNAQKVEEPVEENATVTTDDAMPDVVETVEVEEVVVEETVLEKSSITAQPVETEEANINQNEASLKDELILSALGESWCEIQDSTGSRLFYRLLNSGDEIKISGVAPFTVFLGNAPKVRVEINNKIVDFENLINTNSNIASLEISQDAGVIRLSNH